MTKSASIAIICVICVIALFFGVCSCLPGGLEYGEYNVYNSAISLIQGDSLFSDSVVATYKVKLDEDAKAQDVISVLRSRLGDMYGRWFCSVTEKDGVLTIKVPKTTNKDNVSEASILSDVTATGKVEIVNATTYSSESVVLNASHVKSMRIQKYTSGAMVYNIVNMKLTKEGKEIAAKKLSSSTTGAGAYLAIDEVVYGNDYSIAYDANGTLQVYTRSESECQRLVGLTKSGSLGAKLTALDTEEVSSIGGLVFGIVCAVIILGSWIFYAARYKTLAIAPVLSQLVAVTIFIMFSGYVYFNYLNIASAIGILLGYGLMSCFTCLALEKIRSYAADDKTFASARYRAFSENNKWNCIVHAIVLVVGIILWLIPTGVTAPLGNALVYTAVLSFVVTMGLNRLFTSLVAPLVADAERGNRK